MGIEKVSQALYEYFSQNKYFKILLPLDIAITFVAIAITLLSNWISFGSLVTRIAYFAFIIGVLMLFSKKLYQLVAIAFGLYAVDALIGIIMALLGSYTHYFSWSNFVSLIVYGGIAFLAYKKSLNPTA